MEAVLFSCRASAWVGFGRRIRQFAPFLGEGCKGLLTRSNALSFLANNSHGMNDGKIAWEKGFCSREAKSN
jgi:hypothetical protein